MNEPIVLIISYWSRGEDFASGSDSLSLELLSLTAGPKDPTTGVDPPAGPGPGPRARGRATTDEAIKQKRHKGKKTKPKSRFRIKNHMRQGRIIESERPARE